MALGITVETAEGKVADEVVWDALDVLDALDELEALEAVEVLGVVEVLEADVKDCTDEEVGWTAEEEDLAELDGCAALEEIVDSVVPLGIKDDILNDVMIPPPTLAAAIPRLILSCELAEDVNVSVWSELSEVAEEIAALVRLMVKVKSPLTNTCTKGP